MGGETWGLWEPLTASPSLGLATACQGVKSFTYIRCFHIIDSPQPVAKGRAFSGASPPHEGNYHGHVEDHEDRSHHRVGNRRDRRSRPLLLAPAGDRRRISAQVRVDAERAPGKRREPLVPILEIAIRNQWSGSYNPWGFPDTKGFSLGNMARFHF